MIQVKTRTNTFLWNKGDKLYLKADVVFKDRGCTVPLFHIQSHSMLVQHFEAGQQYRDVYELEDRKIEEPSIRLVIENHLYSLKARMGGKLKDFAFMASEQIRLSFVLYAILSFRKGDIVVMEKMSDPDVSVIARIDKVDPKSASMTSTDGNVYKYVDLLSIRKAKEVERVAFLRGKGMTVATKQTSKTGLKEL